ncbi:MAG: carboxypeptidase-like regulatory domain-containing protein [Pyrinomonadaceae bacterium]
MPIFFRKSLALVFFLLFLALARETNVAAAPGAPASSDRERPAATGSIMGTVFDQSGKPLAGALIVILRQGAAEILRQARTGADGRFKARLAAGSYSLRAAAEGFNTAAFEAVQITPSSELIYRFNLEPMGSGRTTPERRIDRDETKWRLRAAQSRRSIFQISEGQNEIAAAIAGDDTNDQVVLAKTAEQPEEPAPHRAGRLRPQGVVETYAITSAHPLGDSFSGVGLNFAFSQP